MYPHPPIILFDFDGVILNSTGSLIAMLSAKKYKRFHWNMEAIQNLSSMEMIRIFEKSSKASNYDTLKEMYINFLPYLPSKRERWIFLARTGRLSRKYEWKYSQFFPGSHDTIVKLYSEGFIIGIATNSSKNRLHRWLERENLHNFFHNCTTRDDRKLFGAKPSPAPILGLLSRLKKQFNWKFIDRSRVAFIGDNLTDILAAKRAGVLSIATLGGHGDPEEIQKLNPDFTIKNIADLPNHLQSIFPDF